MQQADLDSKGDTADSINTDLAPGDTGTDIDNVVTVDSDELDPETAAASAPP